MSSQNRIDRSICSSCKLLSKLSSNEDGDNLISFTKSSLKYGAEPKREVFLDITKAFDKVWHEGLIYKLRQNGVKGNLLETLTIFLNDRKQRVVLNGQHSKWANIEAGVPQGSILGPLLFLIYT